MICSYNKLEELKLPKNLLRVDCSYNELTELDLLGNDSLSYLNCRGNKIENLDISVWGSSCSVFYEDDNYPEWIDSYFTYTMTVPDGTRAEELDLSGLNVDVIMDNGLRYWWYYHA